MTNLVNYKYYYFKTNKYYRFFVISNDVIIDGKNYPKYTNYIGSNKISLTSKTNYYFTNSLITNNYFYFLSNAFKIITNSLIDVLYNNTYSVIKDNNNIIGYSNFSISSNLATINLKNGKLANNTTINDITYKANNKIFLFENGKVSSGDLANNTTINGVNLITF